MNHRQPRSIKQHVPDESWANVIGKGLVVLAVVFFLVYIVFPIMEATQ